VTHHPGMPPEYSGSDEFYSDANLEKRARPASYADYAPLPGEAVNTLLGDGEGASPALKAHAAAGGQLTPLTLAEIEVDEGGRSADMAGAWDQPTPARSPLAPSYQPPVDNSRLDRLEANLERLTNLLLGDK
jgi:hypothetical protein